MRIVVILAICAALAGCSGVQPQNSAVDAAVAQATAPDPVVAPGGDAQGTQVLTPIATDVTPPPERPGLFKRVFGPKPAPEVAQAPAQPQAPATPTVPQATTATADAGSDITAQTAAADQAVPPVRLEPTERPGLFKRVFGRRAQPEAPSVPESPTEIAPTPVAAEPAAVPVTPTVVPVEPQVVEPEVTPAAEKKPGLFGRIFGPRKTPEEKRVEAEDAAFEEEASVRAAREPAASADGPMLPYGVIAKVCNLPESKRGRKVDSMGGFTLWDTALGATRTRTHYITGFRDGCARKFSGAHAQFGDPYLHEFNHYRQRNPKLSDLDKDYEKIKNRICRTNTLKHCEKNQARLLKTTAFLSIYKVFGQSAIRATVLLHRGRIVAEDFS